MKEILIAVIMFIMAAVIMLQTAENRELINAHHAYVRRTELRQADLEARIGTLERIGVKIDVVDHTGL